jgi:trigger factor
MKVEVKKLPRNQVELIIELSLAEYEPFLEPAAKKISEAIKIPGFRPGKASLEIIKQKVGENQIWQEALELAIKKTFSQALKEQNLDTVGRPEIDVVKLAPGNPVVYKATVSLFPKVKLGDYKKIKITKKPAEVKAEQIKKAISDLQKMRASETLVDRKSKSGDKVEIDFSASLDKIPLENGQSQNYPLVIGEGSFIPGFEDQIIDLAKEETKDFQLTFPQDYHQKNLAGKLVDFKVKMKAVYQLDLPELNDDFAKSLGQFKNFAEVEEKIKDNLKAEANFRSNQELEEEVIDKVIEQCTFDDIPDVLINSETKKMVEELEHNLSHQGLKLDDYLAHLKKTKDELTLDFVPQAAKRVKSALVIREISNQEKIIATKEEINEEIKKITASGADSEISDLTNLAAYQDYLASVLTARKVVDYLKSTLVK